MNKILKIQPNKKIKQHKENVRIYKKELSLDSFDKDH